MDLSRAVGHISLRILSDDVHANERKASEVDRFELEK